jgi:protein ImuB
MRTLCLNLKITQTSSLAEAFLQISPQVQFRFPHFVFIDISSTSGVIGGEKLCLEQALTIARKFSIEASGAIADSPPVAQMLSRWKPGTIQTPGQDILSFGGLGLDAMKDLEGLQSWAKMSAIDHIITFCHGLGVFSLGEVAKFKITSLRERWGEVGVLLWNRLHNQDAQVISPLIPRDPLVGYAYFDDPLIRVDMLMHRFHPLLDGLFARLQGLGRYAHKLEAILHCEYSDKKHVLIIEPISASRDQVLFEDLLEKKMQQTILDNPVREFELTLYDVPEKIQQLDFFEPRDNTEDRWRRLISFAKQSNCEMGFLQIEASHFPEKSFSLVTEWPEDFHSEDLVEMNEGALQVKSVYAKALQQSPRPSLLLEKPVALNEYEIRRLRFVSSLPSERIESSWWQVAEKELKYRDYYFALSQQGQLLWVFQDRMSSQYYLHGYFD